jgi:hypothetical protein
MPWPQSGRMQHEKINIFYVGRPRNKQKRRDVVRTQDDSPAEDLIYVHTSLASCHLPVSTCTVRPQAGRSLVIQKQVNEWLDPRGKIGKRRWQGEYVVELRLSQCEGAESRPRVVIVLGFVFVLGRRESLISCPRPEGEDLCISAMVAKRLYAI